MRYLITLIIAIGSFTSISSHADQAYQMKNIMGYWSNKSETLSIIKQSKNSILIYEKVGSEYFPNGVGRYFAHEDAFDVPEDDTFQVSPENPDRLIVLTREIGFFDVSPHLNKTIYRRIQKPE